jgi:nucleotide-binding universal stress UspA family protein
MFKSILLPTDGSDCSRTALEYGIYIAGKFDARLTGLHVMDVRLMQVSTYNDLVETGDRALNESLLATIEEGLNAAADAVLNEFQDRCRASRVDVHMKKTLGMISDVIVEEGRQQDCIILARRGAHFRVGSVGIGSTVESVIRRSGKPVIVTPPVFQEIESMGLAYDGSPPAEKALKLAVEISEEAAWPLSIIIIANDQHVSNDLTDRIETFLKSYEGEDGDRKVDADIIVLSGREEREIVRFIQDGSIELMVMGAYGHNRLRELILGSTTSYVVHKSMIPILLTR